MVSTRFHGQGWMDRVQLGLLFFFVVEQIFKQHPAVGGLSSSGHSNGRNHGLGIFGHQLRHAVHMDFHHGSVLLERGVVETTGFAGVCLKMHHQPAAARENFLATSALDVLLHDVHLIKCQLEWESLEGLNRTCLK